MQSPAAFQSPPIRGLFRTGGLFSRCSGGRRWRRRRGYRGARERCPAWVQPPPGGPGVLQATQGVWGVQGGVCGCGGGGGQAGAAGLDPGQGEGGLASVEHLRLLVPAQSVVAGREAGSELGHVRYGGLGAAPLPVVPPGGQAVQDGGGVGAVARAGRLVVAEGEDGVQAAPQRRGSQPAPAAEPWRTATAGVQLVLQAVVGRVGQRVQPAV